MNGLVMLKDTVCALLDFIKLRRAKPLPLRYVGSELQRSAASQKAPFILACKEDFQRIREVYYSPSGDAYIKKLTAHAISAADELCDTQKNPPHEYVFTDGARLLEVSRGVLSRLLTLCFAYRVTDEKKYAERALLETEAVCAFPDWHHQHLLDAIELAFAVSLSCDWLTGFLPADRRAFFARTVYERAIRPAMKKNPVKNWYTWSKTNWNTVCYSAVGVSLLAFYPEYPSKAARYIKKALSCMPGAFTSFSPDGVYVEGPGYWEYGTSYLTYFITTLRNFFGHDYSLAQYEGVRKIGYYPLCIGTPSGVFNTGDNKNERLFSAALFWFSHEYGEPILTAYQKRFDLNASRPREAALGALWYDPALGGMSDFSLPKSVLMKSDRGQDFAIFRSGYLEPQASCFAIKGGYNFENHGDLDIGAFILESQGVRFACESGPGDYNAKGYFNSLPFGGRHKNLYKRAEAHGTLLINPQKTRGDQYVFAKAAITSFRAEAGGGCGEIDMTSAYAHAGVQSVVRRFRVSDEYKTVCITDEIHCKRVSEIYWLMPTGANVDIAANGQSCLLSQNGKTIGVSLSGDIPIRFSVLPFEPIRRFPKYKGNEKNRDFGVKRRLCVHLENVRDVQLRITFKL